MALSSVKIWQYRVYSKKRRRPYYKKCPTCHYGWRNLKLLICESQSTGVLRSLTDEKTPVEEFTDLQKMALT